MTNYFKVTLLSATLAALLLPATAQQEANPPASSAVPADTTARQQAKPETIQQHKEAQQDRISNGIANGSLNPGEASALEKKESQINQEERDMRKLDNGHLTAADREALRQQQNQVSKQIYADKHNNDTKPAKPPLTEIQKDRVQQRDRIAQGVASGQLNANQASHLEKQEGAINREIVQDRAANGGKLTSAEKAKINRQQDHMSKEIYKDKHHRK